nr:cyclin-d3-2 [Quercus suber]
MARLLDSDTSNQTLIAGTYGYIAPELAYTMKEKVNDCCNLILELSNAYNCAHNNPHSHKRKYEQVPDAVFSSDSSYDSWAVGSSVYSLPEPLFKKSRAHEQQMKLPPLNRVSVGIVGSPP